MYRVGGCGGGGGMCASRADRGLEAILGGRCRADTADGVFQG